MPDQPPQGIVTALVTPFRPDERIDFSAWQRLIDLQIASGIDGLLAIGGQGEFFSLSEEERVVALRFCKQAIHGRLALYGNVGCVSTGETVRLAQKAEAEGIDYAVVITPYYLKPSADELADHYIDVCRAIRIPVLAYNIPERTGVELTPAIVKRVARACENFIGLKDSSGNLGQVPQWIGIRDHRPLAVFMGRDHLILQGLEAGCIGAVTACANVAPRLFVDLYRAFRSANRAEAARLQALAEPLRQAFGLHTFPSVMKEAMSLIGLPAGLCRRPVKAMPPQARDQLLPILQRLREERYLPDAPGISARKQVGI